MLVDPGMLDYMAAHSGSCKLVLAEVGDEELAVQAMRAAAVAVSRIRHPEEPEERLASFISAVEVTPDGVTFWVDMADAEAYDGLLVQVLDAVVGALDQAGAQGGLLTHGPAGRTEPGPPAGPSVPPRVVARVKAAETFLEIVPVPEPNQRLWLSTADEGGKAGYMVPHQPEELLRFYEALPNVVLSFEAKADQGPYGVVILAGGGTAASILVRDAGSARNIEIDAHQGAAAQELIEDMRRRGLPEGAKVRVDNR